jgi:uncharacterized protein
MYDLVCKARLLLLLTLVSPPYLLSQGSSAGSGRAPDPGQVKQLVLVHDRPTLAASENELKSYKHAANFGDPAAQVELGFQLVQPVSGIPDDQQAFRWFQRAASEQSVAAMSNLAVLYFEGRGVPADPTEGLRWATRAAEHKFPPAETNLAFAYWNGWGTAPNHPEGARWFRRAAEHGFAPAQFALGFAYETGDGVPLDQPKAAEWYSRAAKQKHIPAMNNLAIQYEEGRGVPQDLNKARHLYEQAIEGGLMRAAINLAHLLNSGKLGNPDPVSACAWLLVAKNEPLAATPARQTCGSLDGARLNSAKKNAADWSEHLQK